MRPLLLKISAFGPYAKETIIPMHELGNKGLYLITGDTGAGKTTIFDAICYALYGEASGESRETSMLRSKYADADTPTEVDLTFSHDGNDYRVVRNPEYFRPSKKGEGLTKQIAKACLYMPDGKVITKLKDVTEEIEKLLGINRDQFSQIAMIAQGDFKKLLLADTKQRQEIFRELFKTEYYQKLQNMLETKRKEIFIKAEDGKKSINQYISEITVDENDVLNIEVDKIKKGEKTTADSLEILQKIISIDNDKNNKAKEELNDLNKKLEIINANIGGAETTNKAKTALFIAENKLNEAQPEGRKLKDVFENAKAELKKKDDYTRKIAEIDAELEKYAAVEKLQDSIKNDEKLLKENEGKQSVKEEEKELVIKNLTAIKSEHEAIKDVSGAIEKYKSDLEKAKAKLEEIKELSNDNTRCIKEEELLKQAQEKYAKDNAAFMELQHIYEVQDQMFRDGQAGILAASLNEGDKCPVCGSTVHPDKARLSDSIPSEQELKASKKKAEDAREIANNSSILAGNYKTSFELKLSELVKKAKKLFGDCELSDLANIISQNKSEIEKDIVDISDKLKIEKSKAKRKEEIEELIPMEEGNIKQLEHDIASIREELSSIKSRVIENNNQLKDIRNKITFSNKEEAVIKKKQLTNDAVLLQSNYDKADAELKSIEKTIAGLTSEIESCKKTLDGAKDIDLEEEKRKKLEIGEKQADCIKLLQTVGSRIDINESVYNNIVKQSENIDKIEKELQWMAALSDTANGKLRGKEKVMLETYIQMTYFDRIINRANLRFMKMSAGQYELKRQNEAANAKSQSGLELGVIDHYNGTERSVKTLSGGESFMASLSLALGLSDEVQSSAGGIKVDTMFVDEGFGSLDSDSLDQAYKALASLTEGNRLVGIISHVAELKTKIDSQIIVKKEKTGGSFVSII